MPSAIFANFLHIVHAGAVLDLGDQVDVAAAVGHQEALQLFHVGLGGDEGSRHKIHVILDAEQQVLLVLLAEVGAGHDLVGEAHTLAVAEHAADDHLADSIGALQGGDLKDHQAIVHQNPVADAQIVDQSLVIDADSGLVALHLVGGEGEGVALPDGDLALLEGADAVLGALGIQHDAQRHPQLAADLLDQVDLLLVLGVGTMGEIQTGHVHAGFDHLGQSLLVFGGRADGADDFCFTHRNLLFTSGIGFAPRLPPGMALPKSITCFIYYIIISFRKIINKKVIISPNQSIDFF